MTDAAVRPQDGDDRPVQFRARTKSFTRRSRELTPALERAFARYRRDIVIEVPRDIGLTTVAPDFRLDIERTFGRIAPLVVEVGSGRGEQTLSSAAANPDRDYLAFEVWVPGLARLVADAGEAGLRNIRVIEADAQLALKTMLGEASVSELWTFFPDPWRKSRHHKRRLVSADFAETAARVLSDGGTWRMATDWEDYAAQMLEVVSIAPDLENPYESQVDLGRGRVPEPGTGGFSPRFEGRVQTHFEERGAKAGRPSWDLCALRTPRVHPFKDSDGETLGEEA